MRSVRAQVAKISPTPSHVLITGESGTGKEIAARAIHAGSPRHAQAFVPINCGAIPEALLESQLFGHVRGGLHLRGAGQSGTVRGGRSRHDLPGRNRTCRSTCR